MRALGDRRRKAPIEPAKNESSAPKTEEPAPAPADQPNAFDESVVIS